jgi:hypothetical protein
LRQDAISGTSIARKNSPPPPAGLSPIIGEFELCGVLVVADDRDGLRADRFQGKLYRHSAVYTAESIHQLQGVLKKITVTSATSGHEKKIGPSTLNHSSVVALADRAGVSGSAPRCLSYP